MRVRYSVPALADLANILAYIDARSPQGARKVRARIEETLNLLLSNPFIGARTRQGRRISAWPYPYLIFYEVTKDTIMVHAIRHGARDPRTMPQ